MIYHPVTTIMSLVFNCIKQIILYISHSFWSYLKQKKHYRHYKHLLQLIQLNNENKTEQTLCNIVKQSDGELIKRTILARRSASIEDKTHQLSDPVLLRFPHFLSFLTPPLQLPRPAPPHPAASLSSTGREGRGCSPA